MPYAYAGHMGLVQRNSGHAFFHRLGASRQLFTICGVAAQAGFDASLGTGPSSEIESSAQSDYIVIWGSNTLTTNVHAWPFFQNAKKKGAKIVAIDPYRNRTAQRADRHLMPRPGSDAALALAMMHVLIQKDLIDRDFIVKNTIGFEELKERASEYPPETAAEICGIPASEIRETALEYGRAIMPYIRTGWGPARQLKGGMAMRTIALLPALVGALHKGGGGITRSVGAPVDLTPLTRPDLAPQGVRSVNMVEIGNALTTLDGPPIKLLFVYVSNPAVTAPDTNRILAGMAREDLFTVVVEHFVTETAKYADLILPGASFMEMTDLYKAYGHNYLQMARPVIDPVGQSRPLLAIFQELAGRLGFTEDVFSRTEEDFIAEFVSADHPYLEGIDFETIGDCRPHRVKAPDNPYLNGFNTPSGKVEFFSQSMADMGLDPLPDGSLSLDVEGEGRYPLQLITPPKHEFCNSSFNESPKLREEAGPASLLIHPEDAKGRGVDNGEAIRVFNDRGECLLRAEVTETVRPGLVVAEGLYWPDFTPGGQGINRLTSQRIGDMGNTCAFHCNLVEVEKQRPV